MSHWKLHGLHICVRSDFSLEHMEEFFFAKKYVNTFPFAIQADECWAQAEKVATKEKMDDKLDDKFQSE